MMNALGRERSPYLLQHAKNPVHWLPWGEEAFAQARAEQKPIFLSIGYSTCHWCHVMAHESFEDEAIAALLNEHFVSVKVDREERPDVDKVYMSFVQAYTGQGGWPLSVWLTPELKPFFGGTYFPPTDRPGRVGFPSLLKAIARGWREERDKLMNEADRIIATLRDYFAERTHTKETGEQLAERGGEAFEKCFRYFSESFDGREGGFGSAPKFPRASNLNFLLRIAARQGPQSDVGRRAVRMVMATLQKMSAGGIHDHVGGGFHRYAVDDGWFVPHFEKMLGDQAQIAINLIEAQRATGDEQPARVARGIFDYVLRDMAHPAGGFYSAEDADSLRKADATEHAEGAFYVWTREELEAALGDESDLFCRHFGIGPEGNVPAKLDPQGEFTGKNILHEVQPVSVTAQHYGLELADAEKKLAGHLTKLRVVRAQRPRPQLDDKIITAWNGLMISALARAAVSPSASLQGQRASYRTAAERAAEFVRAELYDESRGVLYRNYRQGRGTNEAYAEDYAFLVAGLLDLYVATFDDRWLQWADRLQETLDEYFYDEQAGGYFNSAAGDRSIVLRLKEDYDGAEPTPGSVAAANLFRLAALTGNEARRARGRAVIGAAQAVWAKSPQALPEMLCALEWELEPGPQIVLVGDPAAADFGELAAVCHEHSGRRLSLLAHNSGQEMGAWLRGRAPWLAEMKLVRGRAAAYVCKNFSCQAPVTTAAELRAQLYS